MSFEGRVAVVTGASAGIGRAVAELLVGRGARVILNARGPEKLEQAKVDLARVGEAPAVVVGDAADESVVQRIVEEATSRWGRIDILVNNAGGAQHHTPFAEIGRGEYHATVRANLESAFFLCQAVLPAMRARAYGRIVSVSSIAGRQHSRLAGPDYAAANAALLGLTRQLAWEIGRDGITVNAVAPSVTGTERISEIWKGRTAEYRDSVLAGIPVGRIAEPSEVAQAVVFLASEEASYINGVTLDVNGGSGLQ